MVNLCFLHNHTLIQYGTVLISLSQAALLSLVPMYTHGVPISFMANFQISLNAPASRFLKPTPWMLLWMLMVYSLVTTSLVAERPFSPSFHVGAVMLSPSWKAGDLWKILKSQSTQSLLIFKLKLKEVEKTSCEKRCRSEKHLAAMRNTRVQRP